MLKETVFTYLVVSCVFVDLVRGDHNLYNIDYKHNDVFRVFKINWVDLNRNSAMQRLNDFLVDRTGSKDPHENLDVALEELLLEYKIAAHPRSIEAKKLFLALSTLNEQNECNYYGFYVLASNLRAIGTIAEWVRENKNLRRIDKILAYFIKRHVNNCREVYFEKFDEVSKKLDPIKMNRLNLLLKKPLEKLVSDESRVNQDKTYVERLFAAAADGRSITFEIQSSHIYNTMIELVKGDADERFVRKIEDEKTGIASIREDKFDTLFREYIAEPCIHLRQQLGPDVFEPALFDSMFDRHMKADRVDFYESWCKYRFCGLIQGANDRVLYYGNS